MLFRSTDQRGVLRPQGAHCDIGAFELTWLTIRNAGGEAAIEYHGVPHQAYALQATTNFLSWLNLQTNTAPANGHILFAPVPLASPPARFFRTVTP